MIFHYEFKKRGMYISVSAKSLRDAIRYIASDDELFEPDINKYKVSVNGGRYRRVSKCLG